MNKQLWIDLLEAAADSLRCESNKKEGTSRYCYVESWASGLIKEMSNRLVEMEQKVDVLQSHRTAIAGLSTQIVELARRVTELEKRPLMDQDLATVFEITKRQVNELLQFRQQHSRFHDQQDKDLDRREKTIDRQWRALVSTVIELERRLRGDPDERRIEDPSDAADAVECEAGGGEGAMQAPGPSAGLAEADGEDG